MYRQICHIKDRDSQGSIYLVKRCLESKEYKFEDTFLAFYIQRQDSTSLWLQNLANNKANYSKNPDIPDELPETPLKH